MRFPESTEMFVPIFDVLVSRQELVKIREMNAEIVKLMQLPDECIEELAVGKSCSKTELYYRSSWARSYLKARGYITNPKKGQWCLTDEYAYRANADQDEVRNELKNLVRLRCKREYAEGRFGYNWPE